MRKKMKVNAIKIRNDETKIRHINQTMETLSAAGHLVNKNFSIYKRGIVRFLTLLNLSITRLQNDCFKGLITFNSAEELKKC